VVEQWPYSFRVAATAKPQLDQIIGLLRAEAHEFDRFGITSLAVFGSVARGEAGEDSDVDVLVEFDGPATFRRYTDLKFFLEQRLGRRVDLVTQRALRDELRSTVEQEAIRVA
jgi:predicted nucleotidyltransferase